MDTLTELQNIVNFARSFSPFYRDLYKDVPESGWQLKDLPVVSHAKFWSANQWGAGNRVLTQKPEDGVIFKTGGTSGIAKFSVYSSKEWACFTEDFGRGLGRGGLQKGDRVANLFYSGDLYASFLFIKDSLKYTGVPLLNFPISGNLDPDKIIEHLVQWDINVLMGVPASLCLLIKRSAERKVSLKVQKIFYGGEPMFSSQKELIREVSGEIQISSVGHASVDGGQLGYLDQDCDSGDHKSFCHSTILEILDPISFEPVKNDGIPGKLCITNLTRKVMPMIRYPVGDLAEWKDYKQKIYTLKGRSDEVLRIGGITFRWDELESIAIHSGFNHVENLQAEIRQIEGKDELTLSFGSDAKPDHQFISKVINAVIHIKPEYLSDLRGSLIRPVVVRQVRVGELKRNLRTGKMARISDLRPFN